MEAEVAVKHHRLRLGQAIRRLRARKVQGLGVGEFLGFGDKRFRGSGFWKPTSWAVAQAQMERVILESRSLAV